MAQRDKEEPLYMISIAAKLCEMHPQTLRLYERVGLIRPQRIGSKNRMYSDADIERLRQIQRLTHELGVNLAGVEVILSLLDQMDSMRKRMEDEMCEMREQMERHIEELERRMR
jgi:MerR family transcriptional regulator/heat shock protein HspR